MSAFTLRAAFSAATVSIGLILANVQATRADSAPAAAEAQAIAVIDLATAAGAASVTAEWRYHDVDIVTAQFSGAGADQQPSGPSQATFDYVPHAGRAQFDDSKWAVIAPESLSERRGHGRLSFNWYRLQLRVPAQIGGVEADAASLYFATRLDDYAEVWVDGELARPFGGSGASVIAGWNAVNRVLLTRHAKAGQQIHVAIFGINGPISDTPSNYIYVREAQLEVRAALPGPAAVPVQEVNVEVERTDAALDAIVPRNAKLFKLAEGFEFTEGPVWSRRGGYLLFSDPNHNAIYKYQDDTGLSVFKEKSGYDGQDIADYGQPGSNGLTFDPQGRLVINEHGRHRVSRMEANGTLTVLADRYRGKRLNSPNDLVVKSDGAVYFTDPPFGLPKFFDDPRKQLKFSGVFRIKDGRLDLLTRDFTGPNGLAFSPDEKYFYLDNWDAAHKLIKRYPVKGDGSLGEGVVFADLTQRVPGEEALDGLKVDKLGHVFVSVAGEIWIFGDTGKQLGIVRAPKPVHNFAWGGTDGKTLYLTARSTLYRLPLLVEGVRP
jgi:gluconolactonase